MGALGRFVVAVGPDAAIAQHDARLQGAREFCHIVRVFLRRRRPGDIQAERVDGPIRGEQFRDLVSFLLYEGGPTLGVGLFGELWIVPIVWPVPAEVAIVPVDVGVVKAHAQPVAAAGAYQFTDDVLLVGRVHDAEVVVDLLVAPVGIAASSRAAGGLGGP